MKALIVANWKMNPGTAAEAKQLFAATKKTAEVAKHISLILAPPALYLRELKALYKGRRIAFAAQNGRVETTGAHTGDVSFAQMKDAGAAYTLIGHAERRALGETDEEVRAKTYAALALKITPVVCIGEKTRDAVGSHFGTVREQLRIGLGAVAGGALTKVIIAYEPVWAIGGNRTMSPRDMHEMAIFIRKTLVQFHGESGMQTKILYGGAVDAKSAVPMMGEGDVDGLLVGRVSTEREHFSTLLRAIDAA